MVEAADLHAGDVLHQPDGTRATALRLHPWTTTQKLRVHNLTVRGLHTYYVLAGRTAVLVHNDENNGPDWNKWFEETSEAWDRSYLDEDGNNAPRGNQRQNKSYEDAVREIERGIGRTLEDGEREALHDDITKRGYGYHQIVDRGKGMLGGTC